MKLLIQLATFISFWILGDLVSQLIAPIIQIPSAIMGMLLLFIALASGLLKESQIKEVGDFFLINIAFFFVPAAVGLLGVLDEINGAIGKLLLIAFVSTLTTMLVTMIVTHFLTTLKHRKEDL